MTVAVIANSAGLLFAAHNVIKNGDGVEFTVSDDARDGDGNTFPIFTETIITIPSAGVTFNVTDTRHFYV